VVGAVVTVLPAVVGAIGKVLGSSVSAFNALPRAERREKLKALLSSKAVLTTLNPVTIIMARQAAKSPAAIEAMIDLLEEHGAQAISAGTTAASAAVQAAAAKRGASAPAAVARTNGRGGGSGTKGSFVFVEGRAPDGSYFGANYRKSQLPALYAALRAAGVLQVTLDEREIVDLTAPLTRSNGRRRNHYHVGPAVAMVNRRRRNGIVSDTLRAQRGRKKLKTRDDMIAFMFPGWKLEADNDREATYRNNDLRASIVQKKGSGYAVPFTLYLWDRGYVGGYAFLPAAVEAAKGARSNPRRNSGPSPWADNAEYEAWKRRHAAEQYARARTAAGKLAVTYGGEPDKSGSLAHGAESGHTPDMRPLGQRIYFGTAAWRVADLPASLYREAPTREGREAIAAYILAHRIPPLRSNGRRSRR
jgi:hypothetical protein